MRNEMFISSKEKELLKKRLELFLNAVECLEYIVTKEGYNDKPDYDININDETIKMFSRQGYFYNGKDLKEVLSYHNNFVVWGIQGEDIIMKTKEDIIMKIKSVGEFKSINTPIIGYLYVIK